MGSYLKIVSRNLLNSSRYLRVTPQIPNIVTNATATKVSKFSTSTAIMSSNNIIPQVLQLAPNFSSKAVYNNKFVDLSLADFKGKYLVLFFYPLDFTFVCPTEIVAFSDRIDEFKKLNAAVVGVSTDSHFSHLAWINQDRKSGGLGGLTYPLLSDFNKTISRSYGVLVEDSGVALRGLFIIDKAGVIRQVTVNDLPIGRSIDEVLRLLQALQFFEQNGEVCPANWKPNSPSIKPDPEKSQEYFRKVN